MTTAFNYVSEVLEIVQETEETRDTFLQRVAFSIQNLPEDGWNDLPTELQDWYNKTADMLADSDREVEFEDIPGSVKEEKVTKKATTKKVTKVETAVEEVESEESNEVEPEEKVEPKKRGRKPGSTVKEAKEPKAPKEPKEPKEPKGPIAANSVREILCKDMNTTLDQLMEKLAERGVVMQRSSAQVVHLNTIRAFEVAVQVGTVVKDGKTVLTAA